MADAEIIGAATSGSGAKYIRTFTGDMIVKRKGGTPDLTPLEEHDKLLSEPPPPPLPEELPEKAKLATEKRTVVPVAPPPPVWNEQVRAVTLERLHAQMAADTAAGIHRSTAHETPLGIEERDEGPVPLRTYSGDFSGRVKKEGAVTFSVLAAEQDAGPHAATATVESPMRKKIYLAVGGLLIILGGAGAYAGYAAFQSANAPVVTDVGVVAPIFVEEREEVSGQGPALQEAMLRSIARNLPTNSVRFLYSTNATTTRDSLFVTARIPAPSVLTRNVVGSKSMAGVLTAGTVLYFLCYLV